MADHEQPHNFLPSVDPVLAEAAAAKPDFVLASDVAAGVREQYAGIGLDPENPNALTPAGLLLHLASVNIESLPKELHADSREQVMRLATHWGVVTDPKDSEGTR